MSSTATYTVSGMTCSHCVGSVTEEVSSIPGVTDVQVDVETGKVVVDGEGFTDAQVAEAVDEAGYALA